jgi:hypothetical protein
MLSYMRKIYMQITQVEIVKKTDNRWIDGTFLGAQNINAILESFFEKGETERFKAIFVHRL